MHSRINASLLMFLIISMFLSTGIIGGSATGVKPVSLFHEGSIKANSRKLLEFNSVSDYDYAGSNPKHGKRGGGGGRTP